MSAASAGTDAGLLKHRTGTKIGTGGYVDSADQRFVVQHVLPLDSAESISQVVVVEGGRPHHPHAMTSPTSSRATSCSSGTRSSTTARGCCSSSRSCRGATPSTSPAGRGDPRDDAARRSATSRSTRRSSGPASFVELAIENLTPGADARHPARRHRPHVLPVPVAHRAHLASSRSPCRSWPQPSCCTIGARRRTRWCWRGWSSPSAWSSTTRSSTSRTSSAGCENTAPRAGHGPPRRSSSRPRSRCAARSSTRRSSSWPPRSRSSSSTGLMGSFFQPLALSYTLAVAASMLVAVTVTPAMALILLRRAKLHAAAATRGAVDAGRVHPAAPSHRPPPPGRVRRRRWPSSPEASRSSPGWVRTCSHVPRARLPHALGARAERVATTRRCR